MGLPKRLTEKQIKFANLVVANEGRKTATDCAIEAGYDPNSAYVSASKLQNPSMYPLVSQYIGRLRSEKLKKYDISMESHLGELGQLRDEARESKAWSAAINAEVARGKAAGLYVEQKIIRTGKIDDLSAEELETRMKDIIDQYSPILENVEVKDMTNKIKKDVKNSRLPKLKKLN